MLADLSKLAGRRLDNVRIRGQSNIDRWEAMLALVRQAECQAEINVALPEQLEAVGESRNELKSVDYLGALKIDQRAVDARQEAQKLARQQLKMAVDQRAAVVSAIKDDINQVTDQRTRICNAADSVKRTAITGADRMRNSVSAPRVNLKETPFIGCAIGFFFVVPGSLIAAFLSESIFSKYSNVHFAILIVLMFVSFVFGFFGWVSLPIIVLLHSKVKHSSLRSKAEDQAAAMVKNAAKV